MLATRKTLVLTTALAALACVNSATPALANVPNGQPDNQREDVGYYYAMTGAKFPTGPTPNGDNSTGGTFRYLVDDPMWSQTLGTWLKDDWFPTNASLALTLKNNGTSVYDNNGIEDNSYGNYYNGTGMPVSTDVPGLYRGYSMSNNFDFIYAGYFKLESQTTFDTIIGYYDENAGFDSDSPSIQYDMNIWSAVQDDPQGNPDSWMPAVTSFTGDVMSSKNTLGAFTWNYTNVDRIFGDDSSNKHDEIWRLTYTLDTAITLQPGVYFFGHDAEVVPEPSSLALAGIAFLGLCVFRRRKAGRSVQ